MQDILDLQKLNAPLQARDAADSCTSSWSNCCNDDQDQAPAEPEPGF